MRNCQLELSECIRQLGYVLTWQQITCQLCCCLCFQCTDPIAHLLEWVLTTWCNLKVPFPISGCCNVVWILVQHNASRKVLSIIHPCQGLKLTQCECIIFITFARPSICTCYPCSVLWLTRQHGIAGWATTQLSPDCLELLFALIWQQWIAVSVIVLLLLQKHPFCSFLRK